MLDVGAGYSGMENALKREGPTHCLCPVLLPCDVNRRFPQGYDIVSVGDGVVAEALVGAGNSWEKRVTVCAHRLAECNCTFDCISGGDAKNGTRYFALADESLHYLNGRDLNVFRPGDKMLARVSVAHEGSPTKNLQVESKVIEGVRYVKSSLRRRPWEEYCHIAGSEYLRGIEIRGEKHAARPLYAYPKVVGRQGHKVILLFGFTHQKCGLGEVKADSVLANFEALAKWKESSATLGDACDGTQPRDDPATAPVKGKQPKPAVPSLDMGGVPPKTVAAPLSKAGGQVPTLAPPELSAAKTSLAKTDDGSDKKTQTHGGAAKPGASASAEQVSSSQDEEDDPDKDLREFIRTRCACQGLKSGTGVLNEILAATARRFTSTPAGKIASVMDEELALVREAQLKLAGVATREQAVVGVIMGEEPTMMQRLVTTLRDDGDGRGNGRVVRSVYNKKFSLPAKKAVTVVRAHDRAVEPGQTIVKA